MAWLWPARPAPSLASATKPASSPFRMAAGTRSPCSPGPTRTSASSPPSTPPSERRPRWRSTASGASSGGRVGGPRGEPAAEMNRRDLARVTSHEVALHPLGRSAGHDVAVAVAGQQAQRNGILLGHFLALLLQRGTHLRLQLDGDDEQSILRSDVGDGRDGLV